MTTEAPQILVVANHDDSREICAMLANAGYLQVMTGAGSDATMAEFRVQLPPVVVVCANLDRGDAQALVAAIHDVDRATKVVMIGEEQGPIRNALDAADFGVDRFLARPLSANALSFSVRTCLVAAEEARAEAGTAPDEAEPVAESVAEAELVPGPDDPGLAPEAAATPLGDEVGLQRETSHRVDRAVDLAIEDFVSDAIGALGEMVAIHAPIAEIQAEAAAAAGEAAVADASVADDVVDMVDHIEVEQTAPVEFEVYHDREQDQNQDQDQDLEDRAQDQAQDLEERAQDQVSLDDEWVEPPPPQPREPTLILSGGGSVPPPVPTEQTERRRGFADAEHLWTEASDDQWSEEEGWTGGNTGQLPIPSFNDEVDDLVDELGDDLSAELAADIGADLVEDIESDPGVLPYDDDDRPPAPPDSVVTAADAAGAGAFARELRRKMSKMAERLFGESGVKSEHIDVGLAHDHQTEIDLTAIGEPSQLDDAAVPYQDFGAAETFADAPATAGTPIPEVGTAESGVIDSSPGTTGASDRDDTTARRPMTLDGQERGIIDVGNDDVASLLARLFSSGFTGELNLRRPPAEKSICFDRGRPVFARSNLPHDRMGDLLFREGKITRAQHSRSRELLAESGRRMGEILIDMGFLKGRELLPAVRRHIEDIIYSLFAWDSGEYATVTGDAAVGEKIRLSRHPAALILEGIRRKYPREWLERKLGSSTAIVSAGTKKKLNPILAAADLSRDERAAIAALDGERDLSEVAAHSGVDELTVYQLAFGLTILGVADVISRGDDDSADLDMVRPPSLVGETDLAIDRQRVLAKFALVNEADYFTLLGVRRNASPFEIRRAYESARRDYAGESFPGEVREELDNEIGEINLLIDEAYKVLRNDRLRTSYLENLRD